MHNHVLNYLDETVMRVPDRIAFSDGTDSVTFAELYDRTRSIGTFLAVRGIRKEPVVVFMNKHPDTVAAFFGVVRGGCFYVPIDEEMPRVRINLILQSLHARMMICDEETYKVALSFSFEGDVVLYHQICDTKADDALLSEIYENTIDTDPVYVVFTSGSTGIPKGVAACHRSIIDYIEQLCEVLEFDENTVFGNQAPLYFDACLKELYPTLKFGATTYLIPKGKFSFPVQLVEYLNTYRINTICWVASALTIISSLDTFRTVKPLYLKTVAFGGEVFPIKDLNKWRQALPGASFTNLYGPTEGTGMSCYYRVDRDFGPGERIPIGKPFPNTEVLLLNEKNEMAMQGEEGEICLRGTCVTLGYYNDPDRTNESYVQNPLQNAYPEVIYRTGDIGMVNERGELVFVTRKDHQIKHMGHRVELGEIEINVTGMEEIVSAACVYNEEKGRIVLFYVGEISPGELTGKLRGMLPRYMVPNTVRKLDEMPFTDGGKVDRVALEHMA